MMKQYRRMANETELISSFLSGNNIKVSVEDEIPTPREREAGVPDVAKRFCYVSYIVQRIYIWWPPDASCLPSSLFFTENVYKQRGAKEVMFSASCSAVSIKWTHGLSAGENQ
jgi:hypothetical protein